MHRFTRVVFSHEAAITVIWTAHIYCSDKSGDFRGVVE